MPDLDVVLVNVDKTFDGDVRAVIDFHAEIEHGDLVIKNGDVLAGTLPSRKSRLVQAWIEIHREELPANWQLAINGEEVFGIDPMR